MYLHTTVQVISHVFAYYGSSDQSCICIVRFKWAIMYLHTTVQVISHVFAYYWSSDHSCFCILRFKWAVMYLCAKGIAFVSSYDFSIGFWTIPTVWYFKFCFSFYQLLFLVYMYCTMIYFSHKMPLSISKQLVLIKDKHLMDVESIL
jgi:hypothetical protein